MKQTNSAIKFLMAQYRAIYKSAFSKGLSSGIALTAFLAASAANAATAVDLTKDNWEAAFEKNDVVEIDGKTDASAGTFKNVTLSGTTAGLQLNLKEGQKLVITDSTSANTANKFSAGTSESLSLQGNGDIEIAAENSTAVSGHGLTVEASSGGKINVDVRNVDVQADLIVKTSGTTDSKVTFAADNITVGDGVLVKAKDGNLYDRANVVVGDSGTTAVSGSTTLGHEDSIITVKKDGSITVNGSNYLNGGSTVRGASLTVDGGSLNLAGTIDKTQTLYRVKKTDINDGYLNVKSLKDNNTDLLIGSSGEINLNGSSTLTTSGSFSIKQGTVNVGKDAKVVAVNAGNAITLAGSSVTSGVLNINSSTLKSFLTGQTNDKTPAAVKYKTDAFATEATAASGALVINANGVLEFSDAADLADFTFSGSSGNGAIAVSQGGVVAGKELSVSSGLTNAGTLTVEASKLTLGSEKFDSKANKFGVSELDAENVKFINKSGEKVFTLQDKLRLETENSGTIEAGDINVSGGLIAIKEGNYSFGKNLTITSGASVDGSNVGLLVNGAKLNLSGKLSTSDATKGKILITNGGSIDASQASAYDLKSGTVSMTVLSNLILDGSKVFDSSKFTDEAVSFSTGFDAKSVDGIASSTLTLTGVGSLKVKQFQDLQTKTGFNGFINGFGISDVDTSKTALDMSKDTVMSGTPDEIYHHAQVKASAIDKAYSFGSVVLADENALTVGGTNGATLKLTNAGANNNDKKNFVQTASGVAGSVNLSGSKAFLQLVGEGNIGAITVSSSTGRNGNLIIGDSISHKTGDVSVAGDIGASNNVLESVKLLDGSSINLAKDKTIYTQQLYVNQGAQINAESGSISVQSAGAINGVAQIYGDIDAKALTFSGSGSAYIAGNATVAVGSLKANEHSKIFIGDDEALGATLIANSMTLASGSIVVDPEFGNEASYLVVNELTGASKNELDGKLVVGKNAVAAIGFDNKAEVEEIIGNYIDRNGSFIANSKIENALVLDKSITISDNMGIAVDSDAAGATKNTFSFGANSALIITDNVDMKGANAAIKLSNTTSNVVNANKGGIVLLAGDHHEDSTELNVFSGSGINLAQEMEITSLNGLLHGVIGTDGKASKGIKLDLDKLNSKFAGASAPVRDLFAKVLGKDADKYYSGAGIGAEYIKYLGTSSMNGVEADAAAHAATYAGAQQAAVAAVSSMSEAVSGRAGISGVEAAVLAATGSTGNGGVWITPMYKSVDSDGFDAQGASYGADVDLAGVTFGADTVRGNMRFGAAFNIGSGDADGKGNGNGLKDEFDYYGFGMYTAMAFGDCSVVADASINVVSHDVKGYSGIPALGELSASADTTAVTMGVTGQYTIATSMVDVVPHLGMRFTRLDTDSYELKSVEGVLANTDYDVQNVFSIPLGVTLSKVFEHNGWAYAPQADISLTFNTGDVEVDSNTKFTGVTENLALNSEVMDKVTYGLNLGFAAQTGNFGTSVSVGYTGSSNTDSVGVNANARYMF